MKRALVISLICVVGLAFSGMAATLSGYWDTDVTINPTVASFADALALTSELGVTYTVGDWAFTSITSLSDAGWIDQDFSVAGVLGAFIIASGLDFDPVTPAFGSWTTSAGVAIAGVTFGADFTLAAGSTQLVLTAGGVAGDVDVDISISFGDTLLGGIRIGLLHDHRHCCSEYALSVAECNPLLHDADQDARSFSSL